MSYAIIIIAILHDLIFIIAMNILGFQSALPLMLAFSIVIFLYYYSYLGFSGSLTMVIIYQLVFDSGSFVFGSAQLRIWYLFLIILLIKKILEKFQSMGHKIKYTQTNIIILWLFIMSCSYIFIQTTVDDMYILKYWLFYVGLIFILYDTLLQQSVKHLRYIDFTIMLGFAVALFGFVQFLYNIHVTPLSSPLFDHNNRFDVRPQGFFSETTWYSEYLYFAMLLTIFRMKIAAKTGFIYIGCCGCFLVGIILSATRNTYVAIIFSIFLALMFSLFEKKIPLKFFKILFMSASITVVCLIIISNTELFKYLLLGVGRFLGNGGGNIHGGMGRIDAFYMSLSDISHGLVFGQGFAWDITQSTNEGNAIGAKSFNLFFMILHIFGLLGFIPFLILIIQYYIRTYSLFVATNNEYAYFALIIFSVFLQISMFAPIHQYPFGMEIIAFSLVLPKLRAHNNVNNGLNE